MGRNKKPIKVVLKLNFNDGCVCRFNTVELPVDFQASADYVSREMNVVFQTLRDTAVESGCCGSKGADRIIIITGRGNHSAGGVPTIKLKVFVLFLKKCEPPVLACPANEAVASIAGENSSCIPTLIIPFLLLEAKLKLDE
ncbi:hypothetical protein POM88_052175 [Heracleum sosnowskyi]|uniref:DUF7894 domain-containing protein n=1 Tax=Heracleum sosnowskyi TaxID=360622 RepID=A0AAD8GRG1_9APIA|nr:hypothetical protein POM88_052175 [Heracleum sosnowskyi]